MKNIITAVILMIAVTSCSTSKKFKSKHEEKAIIDTHLNTDVATVKDSDSSTLVYEDSSFENKSTLNINFDNGFADPGDDQDIEPSPITNGPTINDYTGAAIKPADARIARTTRMDFKYNINGNVITSQVPIKDISLVDQKTGKITAVEITHESHHDSAGVKTDQTQHIATESSTETKEKSTTSYFWLWVIGIAALACIILYQFPAVKIFLRPFFALFKALFAFFKRRKKETPPPDQGNS